MFNKKSVDIDALVHEYADPVIKEIRYQYKQMEEDYVALKSEHEITKAKLEVYERLAKLLELQKGIETNEKA